MSQTSPISETNPDAEKATVLAQRLVAAYGSNVTAELLTIIAEAYESVLSGATCTETTVKPDQLLKSNPELFGPCVTAQDKGERPTQPIAVQKTSKGSRIYLRVMDEAEERVACFLRAFRHTEEVRAC
jgi:hypothetical protein